MDPMTLGYQILLIESIVQVCLSTKESMWYLDSGCSRHMTGDKSKLVDLVYKKGGHVTYGDNNKGQILGEGCIKDSREYSDQKCSLCARPKTQLAEY